jgi:prenylcysteine oxidase/farnesylcysteine lyase
MVEGSGAAVVLSTSVVELEFYKPGGQATNPPKYTLRTTSGSSTNSPYPTAFDNVIIANPYQFSNISAAQGVIPNAIETIPYVRLHVTIFASEKRLKPGYFGWPFWATVPTTVLTTLAKTDNPNSGSQGVGKAGFYSITTIQRAVNPANQKKEYIYKIFSPEIVTPALLRFVSVSPSCFSSVTDLHTFM